MKKCGRIGAAFDCISTTNQQCYRQLETAAGFKASKRFRNHIDKVLIVIEKVITGGEEVEFLPLDFGDILRES